MSGHRVPRTLAGREDKPPRRRGWGRRVADTGLILLGAVMAEYGILEFVAMIDGHSYPSGPALMAFMGASHLVAGLVLLVAVAVVAAVENRPRK